MPYGAHLLVLVWFVQYAGNLTFNGKGDAHATANAQTREAFLRVATYHFVQHMTRIRHPEAPMG